MKLKLSPYLVIGLILTIIVLSLASGFEISTRTTTMTQPLLTTNSNNATLTEYVIVIQTASVTYFVSGTCTMTPITGPTSIANTRTFIAPASVTGYFNGTITTVTATGINRGYTTITTNSTVASASGCYTQITVVASPR